MKILLGVLFVVFACIMLSILFFEATGDGIFDDPLVREMPDNVLITVDDAMLQNEYMFEQYRIMGVWVCSGGDSMCYTDGPKWLRENRKADLMKDKDYPGVLVMRCESNCEIIVSGGQAPFERIVVYSLQTGEQVYP